MKYLITNNQLNLLMESDDDKILMFPDPERMGGWDILQQLLEKRGNPRYGIKSDLNLRGLPIESLGNLEYVGGNLNLVNTPLESLGNLKHVGGNLDLFNSPIESLGNLEYVGGYLNLWGSPIKSLGSLEYVEGNLDLRRTSLRTTEEEIRSKVNVVGDIYLK
jgi:glutamine cyclotransferase